MGDHLLANGQKVWTSYGDKADWMFCLLRTDPDAKKQMGISLVLFDMKTPGVKPKPIKLISGSSPFCETFLDDVRVEKDQIVGEINQGWTIAKYLLTHEREMIGGMGLTGAGSKTLGSLAIDSLGTTFGRLNDLFLRTEVAKWEIDAAAFACTAERVNDEAKAVQANAAASISHLATSVLKNKSFKRPNVVPRESIARLPSVLEPAPVSPIPPIISRSCVNKYLAIVQP
jgi:acyl-CoA dehydrogenase